MNTKRFISSIVAASLTTSMIISPHSAFAMPESLEKRTTENLGNPLGNPLVGDFVSEDGFVVTKNSKGDPILVVIAKGEKGEYNFVDITSGKNLKHGVANPDFEGVVRSWTGTVADNGIVYLSDNNGFLYEANPDTLEFKVLEKPSFIKGEFAFWDSATGDNGWVYFGASRPRGGKVVGYNHNTGEWKDLGVVYPNAQYVRSLSYDNGKIYAGTGSGEFTETFEIDAKDPSKKTKLPKQNLKTDVNDPGNSYMLTAHDGYLYIGFAGSNTGGQYVWDIKNKKYVDVIETINSRVVPSYNNHTVVFNGKDNKLYNYDPKTQTTIKLSDAQSSFQINKTSAIGEDTIVGFDKMSGNIAIRNIKDGSVKSLKNEKTGTSRMLYPTVTMINALGKGYRDEILVGAAGGTEMWRIDDTLSKEQLTDTKSAQIVKQRDQETKLIDRVGDTVVYMQYPNSVAVRIKDIEAGTYDAFGLGAKDKRSLMRPVDSEVIDNERIAIASTPNYGEYTGSITIYNAKNHEVEKHYWSDGLIPASLAYDGKGHLYVGTSVRGEHADLASRPEKTASVLKINMKTGEIVKKQPFTEETLNISAIEFDDKGRLFAYSLDTLLELSPKDLSVVRKHDFGGYKGNNYTDDLLYSSKHEGFIAAMNRKIYWINPDDITIREEIDEGTKVTIADSGNIYYNKSNRVIRAIPYAQSIPTSTTTSATSPTTSATTSATSPTTSATTPKEDNTESTPTPTSTTGDVDNTIEKTTTGEPSGEPSGEPTGEPEDIIDNSSDKHTDNPTLESITEEISHVEEPTGESSKDKLVEDPIAESAEPSDKLSEEAVRESTTSSRANSVVVENENTPIVQTTTTKPIRNLPGSHKETSNDRIEDPQSDHNVDVIDTPIVQQSEEQERNVEVRSNTKLYTEPLNSSYEGDALQLQHGGSQVDQQSISVVGPAIHTGGEVEKSIWEKIVEFFSTIR